MPKPINSIPSYRPISLQPILLKLFEKFLLEKIISEITENQIVQRHQFGFRKQHSTIKQVPNVANKVRQSIKQKEYCSAVFLDVQQAFHKSLHGALLYKIKSKLPHSFYLLLKSYFEERLFRVK